MIRRQRIPHWNAIQCIFVLLLSNQFVSRGLAFQSDAMKALVQIHLPNRWLSLTIKRSVAVRLHSSVRDESNSLVNSKIVGKSDGYSKLPRLFVGSIPSAPTYCTNFQNMGQLLSSSKAPVECREKAVIPLSPEQSRYLTTVLRWNNKRKTDSRIRVFDQHSEWLAQVSVVEDRKRNPLVTVECTEMIRMSSPISRQSILCIAPPKKKERLRWLIEKTVELGVDGFIFLDTEYSEASSVDFDKVQSYVLEAVEQSERMSVPIFLSGLEQDSASSNNPLLQERGSGSLLKTCALQQFLQTWENSPIGNVLIARERLDTIPILEALQDLPRQNQADHPVLVMFLVGPEGGWSLAEEEKMNILEQNYRSNIRNVSLGSTILRSETAAMTAIAAYSLVQ